MLEPTARIRFVWPVGFVGDGDGKKLNWSEFCRIEKFNHVPPVGDCVNEDEVMPCEASVPVTSFCCDGEVWLTRL